MSRVADIVCRALRRGAKVVIENPYSNASIALAAEIGCRCSDRSCIAAPRAREHLAAVTPCAYVYIVSPEDLAACCGLRILLYLDGAPPQELATRADVVLAPRIPKGFLKIANVTRLRIRKRDAVFVAETGSGRHLFRIRGGVVEDYALEPPLERAIEVLEEATLNYGVLSVKDAVVVLSSALGVGKAEARRIFATLRELGLLRIESGVVTPLR